VAPGIFEFRLRMNGKEIVNLEAEIHGITEAHARQRFGLDASGDVLLRVFCTARAGRVILLLHGYDRGASSSKRRQQREIAEATRRLKVIEAREAQARK
jgi:TPP-dependent indolepyruvate ferredoxin oxidoreductase alpha subunit